MLLGQPADALRQPELVELGTSRGITRSANEMPRAGGRR